MIGMLALTACQTTTQPTADGSQPAADLPQIGVTIYKYDDNFMSFVRRNIERNAEGKAVLSMNDSQNDQAKQNKSGWHHDFQGRQSSGNQLGGSPGCLRNHRQGSGCRSARGVLQQRTKCSRPEFLW